VEADQIAIVGSALGSDARAAIVSSLMGGTAHTGVELARHCRLARSTVSEHLGVLVDAGLVTVEPQGRHRYFRLRSPEVAELIEALGEVDERAHAAADAAVLVVQRDRVLVEPDHHAVIAHHVDLLADQRLAQASGPLHRQLVGRHFHAVAQHPERQHVGLGAALGCIDAGGDAQHALAGWITADAGAARIIGDEDADGQAIDDRLQLLDPAAQRLVQAPHLFIDSVTRLALSGLLLRQAHVPVDVLPGPYVTPRNIETLAQRDGDRA